jgi:ribonuclease P protein component
MLPRTARLTRGQDFSDTVRNGRRCGTSSVVVHLDVGTGESTEPSRAGLVVARSVGGSVVRNRVKRRLRHLVVAPLAGLPPASRVVVRALPAAASATSEELGRDLRNAVDRALQRSSRRPASHGRRS